jgi:hypothetical protein
VEPHDHPEILDEHHVIRHTTPHDLHHDRELGCVRLASGAFSESAEGGMSVDIEEWMIQDGIENPLHYIRDQTHGAVRISVGELRKQGLRVGWDPQNNNPHHCCVWGIGNGSRRKKRVAGLAKTIKKILGES